MIQYLQLYKFDCLEDGTEEKMLGRLDALCWELSLRTKFGCADISMPYYIPKSMYTLERQKECEVAKKEYRIRSKKMEELIDLIKIHINCETKIGDDFLYELWISRMFVIDWINGDSLRELEALKKGLLLNNLMNPFEVEINIENVKDKGKFLGIFKRNKN